MKNPGLYGFKKKKKNINNIQYLPKYNIMIKKEILKWEKFERVDQLESFISDIELLYSGILVRLTRDEKPVFYDYWYRLFNSYDAYRLTDGIKTLAFAAYPRYKDRHYERWSDSFFTVSPSCTEPVKLPRAEGSEHYFMIPLNPDGQIPENLKIKNATFEPLQYCLILRLENQECLEHDSVFFREILESDIAPIQDMVIPEFLEGSIPDIYIPIVKKGVEDCFKKKSGWCYCAVNKEGGEVVGFSMYLGFTTALSGISSAIVGDLLVLPSARGKGVGTGIQKFAYHDLENKGIRWICGNIFAFNKASLEQARFVGRDYWSVILKITEN